jgi:UDP-2,3-diacylglucosamine pyrophosphatase LpxH
VLTTLAHLGISDNCPWWGHGGGVVRLTADVSDSRVLILGHYHVRHCDKIKGFSIQQWLRLAMASWPQGKDEEL